MLLLFLQIADAVIILPQRSKIQALWSCCIYTTAKLRKIFNCRFNSKTA